MNIDERKMPMKKKKRCIRIAAFLLIFSMLFSIFPSALAEEMAQDASETQTVQSEADEASQEVLPDAPIDATETEVVGENADVAPETDETSAIEENAPEAQPDGIPASGISTYGAASTDSCTITLKAKVVDDQGQPISGVTVTPTIVSGSGVTFTPQTGTTDDNGQASFEFTIEEWYSLGTNSKTYSVSFSAGGQTSSDPENLTVKVQRTWSEFVRYSYTSSTSQDTQILTQGGSTTTTTLPENKVFEDGVTKTIQNVDRSNGTAQIEFVIPGISGSKWEPEETVLVIDLSNSMNDSLSGVTGGKSRLEILKETLTKENGFIKTLFSKNPNARLGIVTFNNSATKQNGGNFYTADQQQSAIDVINNLKATGGTNFIAALNQAKTMFSTGNVPKKLIFLSDGSPSHYGAGNNDTGWYVSSTYGQIPDTRTYNKTRDAIDSFFTAQPNVVPYSISYGTSNNNVRGSAFGMTPYGDGDGKGGAPTRIAGFYNFLEGIASKGAANAETYFTNNSIPDSYNPQNVYAAGNADELLKIFDSLTKAHLGNIQLEDTMSKYVEVNGDATNIEVFDTDKYSTTDQVGWSRTDTTKYQATLNDGKVNISFDETKGEGQAYKVVIPVKLTDAAYQFYLENGSDAQFPTNESAQVSGQIYDQDYTAKPQSPVCDLPQTQLNLHKIGDDENKTPLANAEFTLEKKSVNGEDWIVWNSNSLNPATNVFTTDGDGNLTFQKLVPGTYRIKESKAPDGYKQNGKTYEFTVSCSPDGSNLSISFTGDDDVQFENETVTFTNKADTVKLTVTKKVEGELGDKTKKFSFTLTQGGQQVGETFELSDGETSKEFIVKKGQTVTVEESSAEGYTQTWRVKGGTIQNPSDSSLKIDIGNITEDVTVECVNTASSQPVTGFNHSILPYVGMGAVVIGIFTAYIIVKRKRRAS